MNLDPADGETIEEFHAAAAEEFASLADGGTDAEYRDYLRRQLYGGEPLKLVPGVDDVELVQPDELSEEGIGSGEPSRGGDATEEV